MMPYLDGKQMAEVDRLMVERYGIGVSRMMEYAGYHVANFIRRFDVQRVLVVCGRGNNGGDGLCAARHLHNRGYDVRIFLSEPEKLKDEPKNQLEILKRMGVTHFLDMERLQKEVEETELVVDALLGYNLEGNPKPPYDEVIRHVNKVSCPVVSVDLPSGFDCAMGKPMEPCIHATHVLCLSFPKKGLEKHANVYVGDMGLPRMLWEDLRIPFMNVFKKEDIVKVQLL
ncbi:MAG TPA: NAD(P)H-hydrate epimerase [Candidatus Bilamarchaeaceae archaeon]|nr:NAD(P)H-hydrate epimerase [Candidatus Bilamarchaeaceae archaeon]